MPHAAPRVTVLGAAITLRAATLSYAADQYPSRPIRLVVPLGAGGNTDVFARLVADRLREPRGQAVIVDNRAGASGIVSTDIVAKAASWARISRSGRSSLKAQNVGRIGPALRGSS